MAEQEGLSLFGWQLTRKKKEKEEKEKLPSIVPPRDDEGGSYATASGSHYGQFLNLDGDDSKDNYQLIMKYRGNAMHPEVDAAIEDIVNETISGSELEQSLDINLDNIDAPDRIKKVIKYPEITKKISTPKKPPEKMSLSKILICAWYIITALTAIALNPSISGLYSINFFFTFC